MRPLTDYHRSIIDPALLEARETLERLDLPDAAYHAFRAQRDAAKHRQIDFLFTLDQWWAWWQTYDHEHGCVRWDRRGRSKTDLVMARFGDVGPYSADNVYCATQSKNIADCNERDPGRLARQAIDWHAQHDCHLKGKRGDRHPKSRGMVTPAGRFGSGALAADHYGITRAGAKHRADHGVDGWHWENDQPAPPVIRARQRRTASMSERATRSRRMKEWHAVNVSHLAGKRGDAHPMSKPVMTPLGRFGSAALAAEAHGVSRQCIHLRLRRDASGYQYV